jgi:hypothetical protein
MIAKAWALPFFFFFLSVYGVVMVHLDNYSARSLRHFNLVTFVLATRDFWSNVM